MPKVFFVDDDRTVQRLANALKDSRVEGTAAATARPLSSKMLFLVRKRVHSPVLISGASANSQCSGGTIFLAWLFERQPPVSDE